MFLIGSAKTIERVLPVMSERALKARARTQDPCRVYLCKSGGKKEAHLSIDASNRKNRVNIRKHEKTEKKKSSQKRRSNLRSCFKNRVTGFLFNYNSDVGFI